MSPALEAAHRHPASAMADNSPEKPDAAAPVASTEQVPASEPKVAGEGELAAKAADKPEGDATMEEAKDAQGKLPNALFSKVFSRIFLVFTCASFIAVMPTAVELVLLDFHLYLFFCLVFPANGLALIAACQSRT